MDAFVISSLPSPMLETLQMAGPLRSADITPLHRYYGPSRHPLVFGRVIKRPRVTPVLPHLRMLLSLDGYSSDCRPGPRLRHCSQDRRDWGRRGVSITRSAAPSPGITNGGRCRSPGHARDDHLGCISSERSQQALHDGVLRRPELFGGVFGEATEDCQRGQTRLGRQPALDVSAVRIENRWHSDALFIWLVHAPMDDALLPQMHVIAEPLRERCCVRYRCR